MWFLEPQICWSDTLKNIIFYRNGDTVPDAKNGTKSERSGTPSETESESSQPSQTGKDFEMVTKEEVEVES